MSKVENTNGWRNVCRQSLEDTMLDRYLSALELFDSDLWNSPSDREKVKSILEKMLAEAEVINLQIEAFTEPEFTKN